MATRVQKTKTARKEENAQVEEVQAPEESAEAIKEATDELLDEIDSLLEENAEEFVKSYVQKGGE